MAILFWVDFTLFHGVNNACTKLNVQHGNNVTAHQNKKVFRFSLTGNFTQTSRCIIGPRAQLNICLNR
jgi:hypothetical protein